MKMNLTYAYIFLVLAIAFEVLSTSFLKDTNGFTKLYPSLIVIVALCICLFLMSHAMQFIPVGIVYATWAGLGIVGIHLVNPSLSLTKLVPVISKIIAKARSM